MEPAFAAANGAPGATIPGAAPIPGGRIGGYRNSSPRRVHLFGLGGKIARVVKRGLSMWQLRPAPIRSAGMTS